MTGGAGLRRFVRPPAAPPPRPAEPEPEISPLVASMLNAPSRMAGQLAGLQANVPQINMPLPGSDLRPGRDERPARAAERCEMCGTDVPPEHGHIADLEGASLLCGCRACYLLFTQEGASHGRYRAVPDRYLVDFGRVMTPAQWDQLFATPTGVFMSRGPAARLGLKTGDILHLITPPGARADGAASWDFQVLGVPQDDPRTGSYILGNFTYVDKSRPLADQGYAWGFRVAVRDAVQANQVSLRIDRRLANSSTPTLTIPDRVSEVDAVNSGTSVASKTWPVAGAGIFMILLLTANGIAQSVRERTPEFAVLKTVGYRDVTLMTLVFTEAVIPCLAGAVLGTGLAAALTRLPTHFLPPDLAQLPKPTLSFVVLAWALGCAALLALASAVIPTNRLRHLSVTDALAGR